MRFFLFVLSVLLASTPAHSEDLKHAEAPPGTVLSGRGSFGPAPDPSQANLATEFAALQALYAKGKAPAMNEVDGRDIVSMMECVKKDLKTGKFRKSLSIAVYHGSLAPNRLGLEVFPFRPDEKRGNATLKTDPREIPFLTKDHPIRRGALLYQEHVASSGTGEPFAMHHLRNVPTDEPSGLRRMLYSTVETHHATRDPQVLSEMYCK